MTPTRARFALLLLGIAACSESASTVNDPTLRADAADTATADDATGPSDAADATSTDVAADATDDGLGDVAPDSGVEPDASALGVTLVINEVAPAGSPNDWFELYNFGDAPIPLTGLSFTDDLVGSPRRSSFPSGAVVEPGGFFVQDVDNASAGFNLGGDEELALTDQFGDYIDLVDWVDGDAPAGTSFARLPDGDGEFQTTTAPTPGAPNQAGQSLEDCGDGLRSDGEACDDGNLLAGDGCSAACLVEDGWLCSGEDVSTCATVCGDGIRAGEETCDDANTEDGDGCSAECQTEAVAGATVRINELFVNSATLPDWIEFTNVGDVDADIGGWSFADNDPAHLFVFAAATVLAPGEYLVLVRDAPESFDFGFSSNGDSAFLYDAEGREVDATSYVGSALDVGQTWGRLPDGVGAFAATSAPTQGTANQ